MPTRDVPRTTQRTPFTPYSDAPGSVEPGVRSVHSSESGRTYRLDRLIGKGGFGEVYLATPISGGALPAQVCVKISDRMSAWLREAYFAELLAREERSLRVFDRFPESDGGAMRYCLVMEYAEHGDLGAWLERQGAQPERFVRREIAAILRTLDALHRGHALHRDLTPFNVFVCEGERLKLGDFGIATHQLHRRGVTADSFNLFHVPNEIAWGKVRRWQKRDDIYQIGLIAAMLLRGDVTSPMRSKDVRGLQCSDHLKEVIHRCLGSRGKRYEAAIAAAKKAGAIVQSKPGQSTDVLVRGRPNALQIAGKDGGSKLIEVRRLAARGHKVTVIGERQFWRLVATRSRARTKNR